MDNTDQTVSNKVLEKIGKVKPKAKVYFTLRNIGMWGLATVSIIIGGLAISSMLFRVVNVPAVIRPGMPPLPEVILLMPFIWILLFGLFGYLAYKEIRSTKKGYTYELSTLILSMLLASIVFGLVFYASGAGFLLDRAASRALPFHPDLEQLQRDHWLHPREGFLVGEVDSISNQSLQLRDPFEEVWTVEFASSVSTEQRSFIQAGERVGVRGEVVNEAERIFRACDIRSLEFEGRGMPPPPGERKPIMTRSTECEDVRPLN